MRKTIKDRIYDTSTAFSIGTVSSEGGEAYFREVLYIKRSGEYFLYGEGAPGSRYEKDGSWGCEIFPLTEQQAREWAKEKLGMEDIISFRR